MKKTIIAAVLALGLATSGLVYAHGGGYGGGYGMMGPGYGMMGGGYGMGPGMMGYGGNGNGYACPGYGNGWNSGQNGWNSQTNQKFLDDTVKLRKELNDKRFEYQEAVRNPNTSREQLAKIEKDIIDLRTQIWDKAQQER